jgi:indole-3-glycerol phosphate synthase
MSVAATPGIPGVLIDQLADARARVASALEQESLDALRARALRMPPGPSFTAALAGPRTALIAEVKRSSPSKGALAPIADPVALAAEYRAGGASVISVLTAPLGFGGSLDDLAAVARLGAPTLRKDFIVDRYQVWEARAAGASAVLLLAVALDDDRLADLMEAAAEAELGVLLEVHDATEFARARALGPAVIGVNVRDLRDFSVDRARFAALAGSRPSGTLLVAESGVEGPQDVSAYARAGADAVLVGEHLVRSGDPRSAVAALVAAGRPREGWSSSEGSEEVDGERHEHP